MALITNLTQFTGELSISRADQDMLSDAIAELEPLWLERILGVEFAMHLEAGLAIEEERFLNIKSGFAYRDADGILRRWEGLTTNRSPLAGYIWCSFTQRSQSYTTADGERVEEAARAAAQQYRDKHLRVWNRMVDDTGTVQRNTGTIIPGALYRYLRSEGEDEEPLFPEFDVYATAPFDRKNAVGI